MTDIKELARGRWREILPRFGIDAQYLNGKNGPCPMCALNGNGGIDRFRWTNYNNDGMWWCNGCSPSMGDGFDLACRITGKVFVEVAKEINGMLGGLPEPKIINQDEKIERARKRLNEIKGKVVHASQVPEAVEYLKGLMIPTGLCAHPSLEYWQDGVVKGKYPVLIGRVISPHGKPVSFHCTYLQGGQKAPVGIPRKMLTPVMTLKGAAIRLFPQEPEVGIAEGIETAIAAHLIHKIPVWSAMNSNGLQDFIPPAGVESVVVFGDNDASFTGQAAAYALAKKLVLSGVKARVEIPETMGDWRDEWVRSNGHRPS